MLRVLKVGVLAFVLSVGAAVQASASTIIDPIVRTKLGGSGSIQIFSLPFFYDFYNVGSFPDDPDDPTDLEWPEDNCSVGTEAGMPLVTCTFQNLTGVPITQLDFNFNIPSGSGPLAFFAEDPDNLFSFETSNFSGALFFGGGGIPSGSCPEGCFGGDFQIDLVGFPTGTLIDMTASEAVPEPATLTLVATGLGMALARRRRRQQ